MWATDCHVHLHDGYDLDLAVRSAWKNVCGADGAKPRGQCWCLASPPGTDGLDRLASMARRQASTARLVRLTDGTGLDVMLIDDDEGPVIVVPGTQAITSEGLEVLSLGAEMPSLPPGGLAATVDLVHDAGGIPVVPWGVGKWLGERGRLVSKLLESTDARRSILLADNANRPWWWPFPGLLAQAAAAGGQVVSGSDPLPVRGDERRIGSAGVYCKAESAASAWQETRRALLAPGRVEIYGRPMSSFRFWHNQILLRVPSFAS